jgi:hypothetical protein
VNELIVWVVAGAVWAVALRVLERLWDNYLANRRRTEKP